VCLIVLSSQSLLVCDSFSIINFYCSTSGLSQHWEVLTGHPVKRAKYGLIWIYFFVIQWGVIRKITIEAKCLSCLIFLGVCGINRLSLSISFE
jgi:hypothetical protein